MATGFDAILDEINDASNAATSLLEKPAREKVAEFTADRADPITGSMVGRGISRSIAGMGSSVSGFLEALSDIVGARGARSYWKEKGDRLDELAQNIPFEVESIADIKSPADAGAYTALAIGQLIPQIVLSVGTGLAARAAAAGTSAARQLGATIAGAAVPSVVQETGGISREIRETSGELHPGIAFPAGLIAGALDTITPSRFIGKVLDTAKDEVKERAWTALVKQTFREIPKTAATEGLTEATQESIAIAANKFANATYDTVNGQNFLRVLDAGIQGMIGGGVIGAATPAIQRAAQPRQPKLEFAGYQESGLPDRPPRPYFTVLEDFGRVVAGSTVSDNTLQRAGIAVPKVPPFEEWKKTYKPGKTVTDFRRDPERSLPLTTATSQLSVALRGADPKDLAAALRQYAKKGAGYMEKFGKTPRKDLGTMLRIQNGLKLWEDMTPEERMREFQERALADLKGAVIEGAQNPVDYMLERALETIDPMSGLYQIILKQRGAQIIREGNRVKIKLSSDLSRQLKEDQGRQPEEMRLRYVQGSVNQLRRDFGISERDAIEILAAESLQDLRARFAEALSRAGEMVIGTTSGDTVTVESGVRAIYEMGAIGDDARSDILAYRQQKRDNLVSTPEEYNDTAPERRKSISGTEAVATSPKTKEEWHAQLREQQKLPPTPTFEEWKAAYKSIGGPNATQTRQIPEGNQQQRQGALPVVPPQGTQERAEVGRGRGAPRGGVVAQPAPETPPLVIPVPKLRALLNESGLPDEAKRLLGALLDSNAAKYFEGITVSIADAIEGGWQGSYWGDLIEIARSSNPGTGPHEFMHHLWEILPAKDKKVIAALRRKTIDDMLARGASSFDLDFLESLRTEEITGQEFVRQMETENRNRDLYHLRSNSEFFAVVMTERFKNRVAAPPKGFVQRVRNAIRELWAAIKKAVGLNPTSDQIFRNLMSGRYDVQPVDVILNREGSIRPTRMVKDIQKTVSFARTYNPASIQAEAEAATGQTLNLAQMLGARLQAVPEAFRRRVANILRWNRIDDVSNFVTYVLGINPVDYRTARAGMTNEGFKSLIAIQTNRGLETFESVVAGVRRMLERQRAKVLSGKAFAAKLRGLQRAKLKEAALTAARRTIEAQLRSGLAEAVERVKQLAIDSDAYAAADLERRMYERLINNAVALETVVQDIAARLAINPSGVSTMAGLRTDIADDIRREYMRVLPASFRPVANPVSGLNEGAALIRVASEILARNVQLRQRMLAAVWSTMASLSKPIRTMEQQIVRDLETKPPTGVIRSLLAKIKNVATDEGKAAMVLAQRYREVTKEVNTLIALEEAERVAADVLDSKEYKAFRGEVARDAKAEVRPQAAKGIDAGAPFYTTWPVTLPSGEVINLRMHQDAASYTQTVADAERAQNEITAWLMDPTNVDSPYRAFYQQQLDLLSGVWSGSIAVNPPKTYAAFKDFHFKIFASFFGMFDPMLRSIGTRSVQLARLAASFWKDANHRFTLWQAKWKPKLNAANVRAARSHVALWDANTPGNAVHQWWDEVLTPIFASWEDPAREGLNVGDLVPAYNHYITEEDMAAVELQAEAMTEAFNIDITKGNKELVPEATIEDEIVPGVKFRRKPAKLTKYFAFRRFSERGVSLSAKYIEMMTELKERKATDADVRAAQIEFWNSYFVPVKSMVVDRNPQFSTTVPFESAIQAVEPDVTNGFITTVEELADAISANSTIDPDAALTFILTEMGRHARAVWNQTKPADPSAAAIIDRVEDHNPFTTNRGLRIAPVFWYGYGFHDSRSVVDFAMSGSGFYFETLIKSLRFVVADLKSVEAEVSTELQKAAARVGETKAGQEVNRQNLEDVALGKATARFEAVHTHRVGLEKMIADLIENFQPGSKKAAVAELSLVNRVLGTFISGVLFSEYTLARNALEGGFLWNGMRLSKLYNSTLRAFPNAFWSLMSTLMRVGVSAVPAIPRAVMKLHPLRATRTLLRSGNLLRAELDFFGDAVVEMADTMYHRIQLYRDLSDAGLGMAVFPVEQLGAMAELPVTGGEIFQENYSANPAIALAQKFGTGILSFIDAQMTLFVRPFAPRIGDVVANLTVGSSTLKGLNNQEAQLRKVFLAYRAAGVPIASLAKHIFTPEEVFGKWYGLQPTRNNLEEIEIWFTESAIPFHESIIRYFERLEAQGPTAEWLTPEEKFRLIVRNVEIINAATPLNRPQLFRNGTILRMVGALMGWPMNAVSKLAEYLGRSAKDPNYNAMQLRMALSMWFLAVLAWSAMGQFGIEEFLRFLAGFVRGETRATRLPTEHQGTEAQAKAWAMYALNTIPLVSTAANMALNDMPNRASFSPNVLVQNKMIDIGNYVAGAWNTRDLTYRLPQTLKGLMPGASVLLNRLPQTEGSVNVMNVARLYRRYGEPETLQVSRGAASGISSTATRLSPYGERIINALARRDTAGAIRLRNEALSIARDLGKKDPERTVEQLIISRLPERRAFNTALTTDQYAGVIDRMSRPEAEYTRATTRNLSAGLGALGYEVPQLRPPTARKGRRPTLGVFASSGRRRRRIGLRSIRRRRLLAAA